MLNNKGLSNKEVIESRKKYGSNNITGKNKNTFLSLFIETLGDPIIKILLIALAIKTIFLFKDFDYFETIIHNRSMDFNRGLEALWKNITKINAHLKKYQLMVTNFFRI